MLGFIRIFYHLVISVMITLYSINTVAQEPYQAIQASKKRSLNLSLAQAISLSLKNNREVKSAYLNRLSDKFSLSVARDLFFPDTTLVFNAETAEIGDDSLRTKENSLGVSVGINLFLPTGGQTSINYNTSSIYSNSDGRDEAENFTGSNVTFSFVQPLLRGGGFKVARSSLDQAEINERGQILNLKALLINAVTSTITAYRYYLLEQRQFEITEHLLIRSREEMETTRALIKSGQSAGLDLIQAETTLAQRELDLESVRNNADAARLNLLDILDIGLDIQLHLTDDFEKNTFVEPTFETAYNIVLDQQPDYLQTLLGLEISEIELRLARNERLWNLDATVTVDLFENSEGRFGSKVTNVFNNRPDIRAGLTLSIPFGDNSAQQNVVTARIAQRQQELQIQETLDIIRVNLQDQLRTISSLGKQTALAIRAEELAGKQLELEKAKLSLGGTTKSQITEFEDELIEAQLNTGTIRISYLNATTYLEQFMGVTLDVWKIPLQVQRYGQKDVLSKSTLNNTRY